MRKILLLSLLFTIISCIKKEEVKSKKLDGRKLEIIKKEIAKKEINLNGKYGIVSFERIPKPLNDSAKTSLTLIQEKGYKFLFSKNDKKLKMDDTFGVHFFNDSIFNYKFDQNYLSITTKEKTIKLPYTNDAGIIRIVLNKKGIKQITIQPLNN